MERFFDDIISCSPLEHRRSKKRTKSEAYFQVGHACTCTVFNFTDAEFFVPILLGNNARLPLAHKPRPRRVLVLHSSGDFTVRWPAWAASCAFCKAGHSKFSLSACIHSFVLFGRPFSWTPAEHSLICLALSHAAPQPIGDSSSALLGSNRKTFSFICCICASKGFLKATREDSSHLYRNSSSIALN